MIREIRVEINKLHACRPCPSSSSGVFTKEVPSWSPKYHAPGYMVSIWLPDVILGVLKESSSENSVLRGQLVCDLTVLNFYRIVKVGACKSVLLHRCKHFVIFHKLDLHFCWHMWLLWGKIFPDSTHFQTRKQTFANLKTPAKEETCI